jgi:hypothetical protein
MSKTKDYIPAAGPVAGKVPLNPPDLFTGSGIICGSLHGAKWVGWRRAA